MYLLYAACNKTLTATTGRILSPRWPANYPQSVNCQVRILTPVGYKISLFFTYFNIEPHSRCNYDYLAVRTRSVTLASRNENWNVVDLFLIIFTTFCTHRACVTM